MPFSIGFFDDGRVLEWEATADGAVATELEDYTPCFYVAARDPAPDPDLTTLQSVYDQHLGVVATEMVARRPGFRRDEEAVLVVDITHIDRVTPLARQARQLSDYPVADLTCFNVDFSREFRYCLETGTNPTPASELSTLRLSVPVTETCNDVYAELSVAGDTVTGSPTDILTAVQGALDAHDPDVLVCSTSEIVPTLYEMATDAGVDDFKIRGIEARQRSTPPFIEDIQRDCFDRLDATRSPDAVLDSLQDAIERLHAGTVPVEQLVERNRFSKPLEEIYAEYTERGGAEEDSRAGPRRPPRTGHRVRSRRRREEPREQVALAHEEIDSYDASYYEAQLVRAVESVLSPLGWDPKNIQREIAETREPNLAAFTEVEKNESTSSRVQEIC